MKKGPIDWTATRERAERMTLEEIDAAIRDILNTLPHADALDREDGGDRGGYYRDEASVLRMERETRVSKARVSRRPPACEQCGSTTNRMSTMRSICSDCEMENGTYAPESRFF